MEVSNDNQGVGRKAGAFSVLERKMFDTEICCCSWDEADAVAAIVREAGFQIEILSEIDFFSNAVFLRVWTAGAFDYGDEVCAILKSIPGALVISYGVADDPPQRLQ
jgi:hypothetical protein